MAYLERTERVWKFLHNKTEKAIPKFLNEEILIGSFMSYAKCITQVNN